MSTAAADAVNSADDGTMKFLFRDDIIVIVVQKISLGYLRRQQRQARGR